MAKAKGRDARLPWIKWYTRDWRADAALRMCSFAARGLWVDLLTLMAESPRFGFLLVEGVVPTARQLAGLLGGTEKEVTRLRTELGEANVFSVTGLPMPDDVAALVPGDVPHGVILSRRMVRDKAKADRDAANGKGGGNPNLAQADKPTDNPTDNGRVNGGVNPQANPQSQKSEARYSEAKASGADRPPDVASIVFGAGLKWLIKSTGKSEEVCRGLIGRWRKELKDEGLIAALGVAQREAPIDAIAWMEAAIRTRKATATPQKGGGFNL